MNYDILEQDEIEPNKIKPYLLNCALITSHCHLA